MAVKYKRKSVSEHAHGTQGRFIRPLRPKPGDPKRRLLVIYLGIMAFTMVTYVGYLLGVVEPDVWGPRTSGVGVVVDKRVMTVEERTGYIVEVALDGPTAMGTLVSEEITIDEASWNALERGDPIGMDYKIHRDGHRMRIVQLRAVPPLPLADDEPR